MKGRTTWMKQKIKGNLMIKEHGNNLNLDAGAFIDTNWNPTSS